MKISSKDLINLPVYTQSEDYLGKIASFEINAETQQIIKYYVKAGSLTSSFLGESQQLIVDHKQVLSLNEEKMVVEDLVKQGMVEDSKKQPDPNQAMPAVPINND